MLSKSIQSSLNKLLNKEAELETRTYAKRVKKLTIIKIS